MNNIISSIPVVGFAAFSGTGKTTLLTQIIPRLKDRNIRLAIIKHAHHNFDIDHPGKDSYQMRKAGSDIMLIASSKRWALMVENEIEQDPSLQSLVDKIDPDKIDLILVEGFKRERFPKIELHRAEINDRWLYPDDPSIIAVATNSALEIKERSKQITVLDINNPSDIVDYLCNNLLPPST